MTLVFFNPIVHSGFVVLDDVDYILSNPPVRAGAHLGHSEMVVHYVPCR